ncbi:MAG: hypothetical protein ACFFBD_10765 [Candidatus Hodarchaeota archaeon]
MPEEEPWILIILDFARLIIRLHFYQLKQPLFKKKGDLPKHHWKKMETYGIAGGSSQLHN